MQSPDNGRYREKRFSKRIRAMPKAIVLIYRKTEQQGMLRSLPLPENRRHSDWEVPPAEVSPCAKAPAVEAVEVAPHRAVPAVEAVLFQEVPVVVAEAVLLREFTVERRVACLRLPPEHREKKATVLSYRTKQLQ